VAMKFRAYIKKTPDMLLPPSSPPLVVTSNPPLAHPLTSNPPMLLNSNLTVLPSNMVRTPTESALEENSPTADQADHLDQADRRDHPDPQEVLQDMVPHVTAEALQASVASGDSRKI